MESLSFLFVGESIRIDSFLSLKIPDLSRTSIQKLIKEGFVLVNGKSVKPNFILNIKDEVNINLPKTDNKKLESENIFLDIVYEDDYILVINKPVDMVVHPAPGSERGTLVNALLNYTSNLSNVNHDRPGIVHRLDKDTTGLIICAKNNETHLKLVSMFANREIKKKYLAICNGIFSNKSGIINKPIGRNINDRKKMAVIEKNSKNAVTEYTVLGESLKYSLLDIELHTGRTHQIRVHLSYLHHPIIGDKTYGIKNEKIKVDSQMLHAYSLFFKHPITNEDISLKVKPPKTFLDVLEKISLENCLESCFTDL